MAVEYSMLAALTYLHERAIRVVAPGESDRIQAAYSKLEAFLARFAATSGGAAADSSWPPRLNLAPFKEHALAGKWFAGEEVLPLLTLLEEFKQLAGKVSLHPGMLMGSKCDFCSAWQCDEHAHRGHADDCPIQRLTSLYRALGGTYEEFI